jgi:NADP-dependent 3-hydroxy acid dehydrogenase YdfG
VVVRKLTVALHSLALVTGIKLSTSQCGTLFKPTLLPGVASGIGRATVHAFADEGATRFVLADINLSGLETVKAELKKANADAGIQTVLVQTYTSVESDVQRMVDEGVKSVRRYPLLCQQCGRHEHTEGVES